MVHAYRGAIGRTQTATVHVADAQGELVAVEVTTSIDAFSDPALAERLYDDTLNVARPGGGGEPIRLAVPVLYHDPVSELLVLVLGEAHRHRELEERIAVLDQLRRDPAAVPPYAKDFAVVFGSAGLRDFLALNGDRRAAVAERERVVQDLAQRTRELATARAELDQRTREHATVRAELDQRTREHTAARTDLEQRSREHGVARSDLEQRTRELADAQFELDQRTGDLDAARTELAHRTRELEAARTELAQRTREHGAVRTELEQRTREHGATRTELEHRSRELEAARTELAQRTREHAEARTELEQRTNELAQRTREHDAARVELDAMRRTPRVGDADRYDGRYDARNDARYDAANPPPGAADAGDDPLTTELVELPIDGAADDAIDDAIARLETGCHLDRSGVRVVVIAGDQLARGLAGALDVRLVLHRVASYPVVALVIGNPSDLRASAVSRLVVVPLDVAAEPDRSVLRELGCAFELTLDLVTHGRRSRRCKLTAPLTDNAAFILRAADDHLRSVTGDGQPHYGVARELVLGPGFDLLGAAHPERGELRDDQLAQTATAQQLRRALAMARRFTWQPHEDYLVCTRSFPIPRWRQRRRDILVRAVAWGLWMGPELAQVAVTEGLARSRRDLVTKLSRGFEGLRHNAGAFDLDTEAAADNAAAIAEEARSLGVELRPARPNGSGAIASDTAPVVSGSISSTPGRGTPTSWSSADLLAELENTGGPRDGRTHRVAAALALCDRGDPSFAGPVIAAAMKMSRSEAVRVLAMAIKFGPAATPALLGGLTSTKAYVRHGCALALALLGSEGTAEAVIALLLAEPTELWREIARAVGRIGAEALIPLAIHYGRLGERAVLSSERVAWAMAHIAVRGGQDAVAALASGQSVIAPVAARGLALLAVASGEHMRERPEASAPGAERDLTVNHAFSRQFFEALERGLPDAVELDAVAAVEP